MSVHPHGTRSVTPLPDLTRELRSALRGEVITPEDGGYDRARRVWNGLTIVPLR